MLCRVPLKLAVSLLLVMVLHTVSHAQSNDFDGAARVLRTTVRPQADGSHLRRLLALRQLRDPSLQSLWHRLVTYPQWQVQVNAVLGLAELADPPAIDPWLVKQVEPLAQEQIVLNALDMDLVRPDDLDALLQIDQLPEFARVVIFAERLEAGHPDDRAALVKLADSSDSRVAALASCLLAAMGTTDAFDRYVATFDALPRQVRQVREAWLLDVIRQYKITSLTAWVAGMTASDDPEFASLSLHTLMALDQTRAMEIWSQRETGSTSMIDAVRNALVLMRNSDVLDPSVFDAIEPRSELLRKMRAAGQCVAAGTPSVQPLIDLLDARHRPSTEWILDLNESLPPAQQKALCLHMLDTITTADNPGPDLVANAVHAASLLAESHPADLCDVLAAVDDDSVAQQAMLLGVLDARSAVLLECTMALRRIGSGRADSLALLVIAKNSDTLAKNDLRSLGLVAAGGGLVSDVLQVQAAWLYLKHSQQVDRALARAFDDAP
jgi:hypothetical protein